MRNEIKYLVPVSIVDTLRSGLKGYVRSDPHATRNGLYTVRSIYLDTPRGAMYRNKVEGHRERLKVRVRGYDSVGQQSQVRMELKRKMGQASWKMRAHASLEDCRLWLAGERPDLTFSDADQAGARQFMFFVRRHALRPVVLVAYDREAFEGHFDPTLRITFDMRLRGCLTEGLEQLGAECPVSVMNHDFILEVKYNHHYPKWLKPLLAEFGLQKRALSKYVLTLDACARGTHGRRSSFSGGRVMRRSVFQQPF